MKTSLSLAFWVMASVTAYLLPNAASSPKISTSAIITSVKTSTKVTTSKISSTTKASPAPSSAATKTSSSSRSGPSTPISIPSVSITIPTLPIPTGTSVPTPGVCGVRAGNIVQNGGFAQGLDYWNFDRISYDGGVGYGAGPDDGASLDEGNVNCFLIELVPTPIEGVKSQLTAILSQNICLVPGSIYTLFYLTGIDGDETVPGDSGCKVSASISGKTVVPERSICGGANAPSDYGTCIIPNTDDKHVRYEANTAVFTATQKDSTIAFTFDCAGPVPNQYYPDALLDAVKIFGP